MTNDEMLSELDRINAVVGKPLSAQDSQKRSAFVSELYRKFSWMTALQWREIVTWVVDHHKTRLLPTLDQFSKAVEAMRNRGVLKTPEKCVSCNGTRFVHGKYFHEGKGEVIDAVRHCPVCTPNNWETKPELTPMVSHDDLTSELAQEQSPRMARWVLSLVDSGKVKYPERILKILLDRAGEDDPPNQRPTQNPFGEMIDKTAKLVMKEKDPGPPEPMDIPYPEEING